MSRNRTQLIDGRKHGPNRHTAQRKLLKNRARHEKIVNSLAKFDFSARYKYVLTTKHKKTGQWFLEAESFQHWLRTEGQTLWCPGIPGAGKTLLLAVAVNYLQGRPFRNHEVVLFAFCDYKDQRSQNPGNMFLSLWRQLMQKRVLSEAECDSLESTYLKRGRILITDAIVDMFLNEASKYSRVFILLDALDELRTEDRDLLLYILSTRTKRMNVLITSRTPEEKTWEFRYLPQLEIRAGDKDIMDYQRSSRLYHTATLQGRTQ